MISLALIQLMLIALVLIQLVMIALELISLVMIALVQICSNGADPTGDDSIDTESTDACVHIPEISTRSNKIAQIYLPDLPLFAPLQSSSSAIGIEVIQIRNPAFF